MAGVALIILKNPSRKRYIKESIQRMSDYLDSNFSSLVEHIEKPVRSDDVTVIQFKKNDANKFYQHKDGGWIAYEGHVFALNETKILDAGQIWQLYRKYGDSFPAHLDGDFVIKLFDAKRNEFLICNDIIKGKSNYLLETDDVILFSPYLILSACFREPKADLYALNEYLWRYYIQSDRTMFDGTERLKPASVYKIKNGKIEHKRYWQWPRNYTDLNFRQAADELTESIKESARLVNQYDNAPIIELTMGQDSRMVAAGFTNQQIPFISTIYGKDDFPEVIHAAKMAERRNREHHHIKLENDYLKDPWSYQKKSILLGSAEEPGYLAGRILYMRSRYKEWSDIALSGMQGRYYKDGLWNELYVFNLYREPKSFDIDLFLKYRALNKNYPDTVFNEKLHEIKKASGSYFRTMVEDAIQGYENSPVAIQVDKFDLERYAMFGQASSSTCNNVIDLLSPLLFRRNLELALTMPPKWKYNLSKIQREVVYKLDPQLAAEITDVAGINMVPKSGLSYLTFITTYWYYQSKKFRDKLKNKFNKSSKTQLQKAWDYYPIHQMMFRSDEVRSYLHADNLELSEIVQKPEWHAYLNRFKAERMSLDDYEFIFKLLTVEYFLKEARKLWRGV